MERIKASEYNGAIFKLCVLTYLLFTSIISFRIHK